MPSPAAYRFGPFTLQRDSLLLRRDGQPVPLGDRAARLLLVLLDSAAQVVGKAELMRRAWPQALVDESTLRFHIANLRKALGDGTGGARYIVNVSGRGYCFVAPAGPLAGPLSEPLSGPDAPRPPGRAGRLLGRERALEDLATLLPERRFVSVVGAGGMGKSRLAFALAAQRAADYPDGIFILDVALIGEEALVATTLAHQMGVAYAPGGALEAMGRWLSTRRALVLLDSCETQMDACATLAQRLLQQAPQLHLLATSREALRVKGEWVLQLKPLATPEPPWAGQPRAAVLACPSVQLMLERARALRPGFELAEADLPLACELVHRLDGMPLAIELASGRLDAMPLAALLRQLDGHVLLRDGGTAPGGADSAIARHRTLGTLLDWSYERLSPAEQAVLRRLSVCNGAFTLDTAQAVASDHALDESEVVQAVMGLEMKSLLSVEAGPRQVTYRLLDSTRAYAAEQLGEGDEYRMVRIQQCVHLHDTMLRAEADSPRMPHPEWMQVHGPANNDMRANLAWAFGPGGDVVRGIRLVAAAIAFAHQLALAEEYGDHLRRALDSLPALPRPEPDMELRLRGGLFVLQLLSRGPAGDMAQAHARVLDLAEQLDDDHYRVQALNGLFVQAYFGDGDYPAAARHAQQVAAMAARHPELAAPVDRLTLQAWHGLGQHERARPALEALMAHPPPRQRLRPPFPIDMAVMARMMLVRIHWLQGRADDALDLVAELEHLAARDVRFAPPHALAWSICPLHLWRGDLARARQAVDELYRCASQLDMPFSAAWACAYDAAWARRSGLPRRLADTCTPEAQASTTGVVAELLGTMDPGFVTAELRARLAAGTLGWCAPEIHRALGELALAPDQARAHFTQALDLARQQGALAWELRAATSLARLALQAGRRGEARALLEPVLARLRQGLDTEDVRRALALLQAREVC